MCDAEVIPRNSSANNSYQRKVAHHLAKKLYTWTSANYQAPTIGKGKEPITLVCISDTHGTTPGLPEGDILFHCGDLSHHGTFDEIQTQLDWLNTQSHAHKVVIAGNHDLILDDSFVKSHPNRTLDQLGRSRQDLRWGDVKYLQDSTCSIECRDRILRVFGSPHVPYCGDYAFQHDPKDDIWKGRVEDNVDILLTHMPPATHFDDGKGSRFLSKEMRRAKPKIAVFGHIHGEGGQALVGFDAAQTCYENVLTDTNMFSSMLCLTLVVLWQLLTNLVVPAYWTKKDSMLFVNATVAKCKAFPEGSKPMIVRI